MFSSNEAVSSEERATLATGDARHAALESLRRLSDDELVTMLRHALPSGDDEAILDRALSALLEELARKKFGGKEKSGSFGEAAPRSSRVGAPDSRHVPAAVKRVVWVRDLARCTFVGTDGRRCGERAFVEFHHVRPYAVGGEATVEGIQLRCRRHNRYEARVYFARGSDDEGSLVWGWASSPSVRPAWRSSRGRGANRRDREVVPERVVPAPASAGDPPG